MATLDMPANKTDTKCEKNKDKEPDIYNVGCSTTDFLEDKHIFFCNRIVDRRNFFNQSASSLSQFKSEGYMHQATIFFVDIKGILATPPKATPPKNKALLRVY